VHLWFFAQRAKHEASPCGKLEVPLESFVYGMGDKQILTTLCPSGKERMCKLMEMVRHGRFGLTPLITHASRSTRSRRPTTSSATSAKAWSKSV
jgi:hypothetical protein